MDRSRRESLTVRGESTSEQEKDVASSSSDPSSQKERAGEDTWDMREENPPDGRENVAEWREGHDKIIERRGGPGEEVEVQVLKNAYGPGDTQSHTLRVAEETIHDAVREIRDKLTSPHLRHDAKHVENKLEGFEDKLKEAFKHPTAMGTSAATTAHNEEEDEGWMSDRSDGTNNAPSSSKDGKHRKQSKSKIPKLSVGGGRRRQSFRRSILPSRPSGNARMNNDSGVFDTPVEDQDEDDRRGRRPLSPTSPGGGGGGSGRPSLRHTRVDSLRLSHPGSREMSPARSIRWADEHPPAGAATPPTVSSPLVPGTPLLAATPPLSGVDLERRLEQQAGREDREDQKEGDSPQSLVRFELPPHPSKERQ